MILRSILQSQASRFLKLATTHGMPYIPDALVFVRDRYGFVETPTNLSDFNPSTGITFSHGKFQPSEKSAKDIVIRKLQIYEQGLLADTQATVEDADMFLDDFISWSCSRFDIKILDYPPTHKLYHSNIELHSNLDLESPLRFIKPLGHSITNRLKKYGGEGSFDYAPTGFSLHCDMTKSTSAILPPVPSIFTLERLARHPFGAGIFVSSAPLKTADHIALIEEFEGGLRDHRSN